RSQPGYVVMIKGSGHISFMDIPFLPVVPGSMVAAGMATIQIEREHAWRVICDHLLAFFARHPGGAPDPHLEGLSCNDPEVAHGPPHALVAGHAT
ncbi:MAG: hypothetical protein ACKVVP_10035, partial [Chloroflexota bacterium]